MDNKASFETVCFAIETVYLEMGDLAESLYLMCNWSSYLDRLILEKEIYPEIDAMRFSLESATFALYGWTREDYTAAMDAVLAVHAAKALANDQG